MINNSISNLNGLIPINNTEKLKTKDIIIEIRLIFTYLYYVVHNCITKEMIKRYTKDSYLLLKQELYVEGKKYYTRIATAKLLLIPELLLDDYTNKGLISAFIARNRTCYLRSEIVNFIKELGSQRMTDFIIEIEETITFFKNKSQL